ncbi:MAG: hypothetical protein WA908_01805 [Pontixanthobacter sp.]
MTDGNDKSTREERLAAKLRENLRRRKTQSRELNDGGAAEAGGKSSLPKEGDES